MIAEIRSFLDCHPCSYLFVDNVHSLEPVGIWVKIVRYRFDGFMDCIIAQDALGTFWDFQNCHELPPYWADYKSYDSLNDLLEVMDDMLQG